MVQRTGKARRKTRYKLQKNVRNAGKLSIRNFLQILNEGDKVNLVAEPGYQKGLYYPRYHGKVGTVKRKVGECYEVVIKDFAKAKTLIVHPVHLKRI